MPDFYFLIILVGWLIDLAEEDAKNSPFVQRHKKHWLENSKSVICSIKLALAKLFQILDPLHELSLFVTILIVALDSYIVWFIF